jgi:hypothetical protein
MADNPLGSNESRGRGDPLVWTLFLIGVGAAIAAIALPQGSIAASGYVKDGLAGIAAAIVSAGAFIAFAIARPR